MSHLSEERKSRLLEFVRKLAPYSIIESALDYYERGQVIESYRTHSKVQGVVSKNEQETFTVSLSFLSEGSIEPQCTCHASDGEWCEHGIALLWAAGSLGFFDSEGGFDAPESIYRINPNSPREIALVIEDIKNREHAFRAEERFKPHVAIELDLESDRLGVRVLFDDKIQSPTLFKNFVKDSSRALDNILLELLDENGLWDEDNHFWYISQSKTLETVLGLIQEYGSIVVREADQTGTEKIYDVRFEETLLEANLEIEWQDSSAELIIHWILPDGTRLLKYEEVIGTGPYWVAIDRDESKVIYKLSPLASRIASIFPYSSTIALSKAQTGPILGALSDNLFDSKFITIKNPDLQPDSEIKSPAPQLDLKLVSGEQSYYEQPKQLAVYATLEFEYPRPPEDSNLVYLADREKEREYSDYIKSLGFEYQPSRKRYVVVGDQALDFIAGAKKLFSSEWSVLGLDSLRRNMKFAQLNLNISISQPNHSDDFDTPDDFDCHISLVQNNAHVPISTLFKNRDNSSDRWIKLDSGAYAQVPGGGFQYLESTLGMLDANYKLSNTIKRRLTPAQAISLTNLDDDLFNLDLDSEFRSLSDKFQNFKKIKRIKESKKFLGTLRPYQREGLSWLNFLADFGFGGILADEMGLGKTIQTLSLLLYRKLKRKRTKPSLIVVPTSIITNWAYEAQKFTPDLKVLVLHGSNRKELYSEIDQYDLVITSYVLLRLDRKLLEKHSFTYVILDEAQNIKNYQAATTKAAKSLKSDHRLALTGTPTENRPMELWSIFDFLMTGYLGSSEFFRKSIEKPILDGGPSVTVTKFLKAKTLPFILRRTKSEVEKDLPPKIETVLHVDMAPSQRELYHQILSEVRPRVMDAVSRRGVGGASVSILAALLRLRQVCNHPNSIETYRGLEGFESGKFNLLKNLLDEALESGRKILLYSQFLEMLSITKEWLDQKGISYLYLDGSTKNRQDLVDRFNSDDRIRLFLISLKAGGTGLNLTGADTVVIYDPWWNPAVEDQAADRAHRIGQTKTVNIYRLVTEETVESHIMTLKSKKARIVDALINQSGLSPLKLTKREIEQLFSPIDVE